MTPTLTLAECKWLRDQGLVQKVDGIAYVWEDGVNYPVPIMSSETSEMHANCVLIPTEAELRAAVLEWFVAQHPNDLCKITVSEFHMTPRAFEVYVSKCVGEIGWNVEMKVTGMSVSAALFALAQKICGGEK